MAEGQRDRREKWDSGILARMIVGVMVTLIKTKKQYNSRKKASVHYRFQYMECLLVYVCNDDCVGEERKECLTGSHVPQLELIILTTKLQ